MGNSRCRLRTTCLILTAWTLGGIVVQAGRLTHSWTVVVGLTSLVRVHLVLGIAGLNTVHKFIKEGLMSGQICGALTTHPLREDTPMAVTHSGIYLVVENCQIGMHPNRFTT
ncbi:hypothetical protein BJ322DRAFT_1095627, partial [Thelephora terrestris]